MDKEPNWEAILASTIWTETIYPMLSEHYQFALEQRLPGMMTEMPTLEEYHFWRGYAAAIKMVKDAPQDMMEANRQEKEKAEEDAFIRQQTARRRRTTGY